MNIIDITAVCNEDVEIIGVYNNIVYYFKGLAMGKERNIEVFYYDKDKSYEGKIEYDFIHTTDFYDKEISTYETYAEVVFKNGSIIIVYKIDFISHKIDKLYSLTVESKTFNGVKTLGDRYIIIFTDTSDIDSEDFSEALDMNGYYEGGYLYDSENESKHYIYDKRLILGLRDNFIYYTYNDEEYVLFEEVYMEQWKMEHMYFINSDKEQYGRHSYKESLNIMLLKDLVYQIENESYFMEMLQIHSTEMNGWTRYFGMDEEHIYFRSKCFDNGIEEVYKVSKYNFIKEKIGEIDHNIYSEGNIRYDKWYQRVILDYPSDEKILVKGIYNFPYETFCSSGIGILIEAASENCIVASYWKKGSNEELIDCVGIKDLIKGKFLNYEGIAHIDKENIVIYK